MNLLDLPVRRPVAVAMAFLAIAMVGLVAWQRIPIELYPNVEGDTLWVNFSRPGSEPETVEREILLPLEARVAALPMVLETSASVRGAGGNFQVLFERGVDIRVRELELRRIAAAIGREQPEGTSLYVSGSDTSNWSTFVMMINVLGGDVDRNALFDVTEELIAPRFAAVPGVTEATTTGGAPRQVTLTVDPARAVALGVSIDNVSNAVRRNVGHLRYVGNLESATGITDIVLDGRPAGIHSLAEARIIPGQPAQLRHAGELDFGTGIERSLFRVNGKPSVGIAIYQEQGANLVRLGRDLRAQAAELGEEVREMGLELVIGTDAAEQVEEQIGRLARLGLSGFGIALMVLYLFLRQWQAVTVVAIAVPVSLLAAFAILYLFGDTLNMLTLFGLALAVGLLVDNSVVVFESVQRSLDRGAAPNAAVRQGLRRTVRAIAAASLTTAVVFLPLVLIDVEAGMTSLQKQLEITIRAFLVPLATSLLVAVALVPLLAHRLAAPAAVRRLARRRETRAARGGMAPPDPLRILFGGMVASALRRPPAWLTGTVFAVVVTVMVAIPLIALGSGAQPTRSDTVQLIGRFDQGGSLRQVSDALAELESALGNLDGVDTIETVVREDGGSITVELVDEAQRPAELDAALVRKVAREAARKVSGGFELLNPGDDPRGGGGKGGASGGGSGAFGNPPGEVVLSGPDSGQLERLAKDVVARLDAIPYVQNSWLAERPGLEEIWIQPRRATFEAYGITIGDVLPNLGLAGREGRVNATGFTLPSGRELPVILERVNARTDKAGNELRNLRLQTAAGVVPIAALADIRQMPARATIEHKNGRRETRVYFRLGDDVSESGSGREAIDEQIAETVRAVPRPRGFTVEVSSLDEQISWIQRVLVPVVLLLFLVLALTFESLTLPVLVLLAVPLTVIGASWALVVAGMSLGPMAALGAIALFGLTVNPAILLVDRMQQKVLIGGWTAGAAAFASVRERTRPVLMTTATTIAALWPLAISTGRENEIWPPFATVVIGGLVTSSLLTLLVIPVGFILLHRLDRLFGRVGPWLVVGWLAVTVGIMFWLIQSGLITSLFWQAVVSLLVGGGTLAFTVVLFRRPERHEPESDAGPPALETRNLRKVYGLPGPLRRALAAPRVFAARALAHGDFDPNALSLARAFSQREARERLLPAIVMTLASAALAVRAESGGWRLFFCMLAAVFVVGLLRQVRRSRGRLNAVGAVEPGGVENFIAPGVPWAVLGIFACAALLPVFGGDVSAANVFWPATGALLLGAWQLARHSAAAQAKGQLRERAGGRFLRYPRTIMRRWARRIGGFDLPTSPVEALVGANFRIERGMVGILGPNGAGKTTLLRLLTGILDPSRGTIALGGVPLAKVQRVLARWVGYLPQDAGLPSGLSPREYLRYFAALYDLPPSVRHDRVEYLLSEVGLHDRAGDRIGSLSGGMRQRVSVARTLLRLPPIIVVDEPTVGLDPRERIRFRNLLANLARDRIVLFSTHVVEDVAVACERVLVLSGGRVLFDGAPGALAEAAQGKVWETQASALETVELPPGTILAEETPLGDGRVTRRVLAERQPEPDAKTLESRLEDGYLWLLRGAGDAA